MSTQYSHTAQRLADLQDLERETLITLWVQAFGDRPFKGARRQTLLRGVSYAVQAQSEGDLSKRTKRKLLKLAVDAPDHVLKNSNSARHNSPQVQLGTQLVREWNGKTYTVHVTDNGCILNGVAYGSLSAVAKAITGAHWSGPRFFGVRSPS